MKSVVLDLMCDLDEAELLDRAQQLSSQLSRLEEVEMEKGNVAKRYADQLKEIGGAIRKMAKVIRHRAESRAVTCQVMFHSPVVGTKRTVRMDTGEFVKDEAMSSIECQNNLFEEPTKPEQAELVTLAPAGDMPTEEMPARAVMYGDEPVSLEPAAEPASANPSRTGKAKE